MLARNISAGFLSAVWTALLGFAVVPIYLRLLGVESYGLVGFLATLQAMMQLLDMGIAPTVNREVARHGAQHRAADAAPMVRTIARLYWPTAAAIGLGIALASPLISTHWLQTQTLAVQDVQWAVALLGLVIACRWPNGIYLGVLMGTQRIQWSSAVTAMTATLSSVGSVLVLSFVSPTLQALFAWQACAALIGTLAMRAAAWRALGVSAHGLPRASFAQLRHMWRFSAGMGAIGLLGLVFTQMDKVLLSRLLPLPDFGRYMLAITVTSGLYVFVTPFFNALYPRFSALVAGNGADLEAQYRLSTRLLATVLFPVAGFLAFFSIDLVAIWTGNDELARSVGPLISLLAIGSALHGVMHIPHALQLASGNTRLPLIINSALLLILLPLIVVLAQTYGAMGGAMAWLMLHCLYVMLGTWLTHRHLLPALKTRWLASDVLVPLLIAGLTMCGADLLTSGLVTHHTARLVSGLCACMVAAAACCASSAQLRTKVIQLSQRAQLKAANQP